MNKEIITTKIAIFQKKEIRKTIHKDEWWFSIIDIIEALTETTRPRKYWNDLKKKLIQEGYFEVSENIGQLKILAPDGKMRETDCAGQPASLKDNSVNIGNVNMQYFPKCGRHHQLKEDKKI